MGRKSTLPYRLQAMLATLTDAPFDDPEWVFEDKFDGFRMVAEIRRGRVALYSRNGKIISHSYVEVAKALARISHTTERFLRSALIFSWMANVENAARCRQCASIGVLFSGLREPVCDATRSTRRGDASQTGAARALAAPSRRRAARAHSSAVGQAEAMAMRTGRTEIRINAPIFRNLRRMVPQVASAKTVLARPIRRSAQIRT